MTRDEIDKILQDLLDVIHAINELADSFRGTDIHAAAVKMYDPVMQMLFEKHKYYRNLKKRR